MRKYLLFAGIIAFLYSSWGPGWGPQYATWALGILALLVLGPLAARLNRPSSRRHDYYEQPGYRSNYHEDHYEGDQ